MSSKTSTATACHYRAADKLHRSIAAPGLILVSLVVLSLLAGCTDDYKGRIKGTVTSEDYNIRRTPIPYPVPDVSILVHSLKDGSDVEVITDEEGVYEADDVPFGLARLTTIRDGFTTIEKYADVEKDTTTVVDFMIPEVPERYVINMTVSVKDSEGNPISGATINAYRRSFADYGYTDHIDQYLETGVTGDDGRVFFIGLNHLLEYQVNFYRFDAVAYGYEDARKIVVISYNKTNLELSFTMEPL